MNSVNLIGRLTKDAVVTTTTTGKKIARFTLAVDKTYGKGTNFISCVAWEHQANYIDSYIRKGDRIGVVGEIETGSYEKDGNTIYTTEVKASRVEGLGGTKSEGHDTTNNNKVEKVETKESVEEVSQDVPWQNMDI